MSTATSKRGSLIASGNSPESSPVERDRAVSRIVAAIHDGLRHGFFEYVLSCEIGGHDQRRLTLKAGKSYQFVIPKGECVRSIEPPRDSYEGSAPTAD